MGDRILSHPIHRDTTLDCLQKNPHDLLQTLRNGATEVCDLHNTKTIQYVSWEYIGSKGDILACKPPTYIELAGTFVIMLQYLSCIEVMNLTHTKKDCHT